ncbi:uncharacterized protein LOC126551598 [Aphis gossypii]|uniref:uncharacterized protein LOC126551596 n=1 Tax=Aphis gossypii TaxID=80765 RepID=UPI0021590C63|nr:uncharacterized protein LOC126551596 [Aphis gossypii]XP_050061434.1 uncharacterized protein LOC126551598 [Aphis gossypii]
MNILWPDVVLHDNVLLFVSDAAPYMVKAGKALNAFFPKMIHITCLAHAFHRIAETIRSKFIKVDELISTVKKIFLKAPSRIETFKNMYPDLSLPPQPIVTRWGTWLNAANYYCQNFKEIKNIVDKLDPTTSMFIEKAEILLKNNDLKNELVYISVNYFFLVDVITKLETRDLTLVDSLNIVEETVKKLEKVQGKIGEIINTKIKNILQKNSGFAQIKAIKNILTGCSSEVSLDVELTPSDIAKMQYCPITSVEVERSFSRYKAILRPNRRSFEFENLKMHVIINCNCD